MYGLICFFLLGVSAYFVWITLADISLRVDETHVAPLWKMYGLPLYFLCALTGLGVMKFWQQSGLLLTMRLLLITVYLAVFQCVFDFLGDVTWAFYIGEGEPQLGLVSTYEMVFIYVLFVVGSLFQWIMIKFEARRAEMNTVVGGVLIVMGIMLPKMLESYSTLNAYCSKVTCESGVLDASVMFMMGIAYAAALSAMFIVGLFSSSIMSLICSCAEFVVSAPKVPLLVASQNSKVPVSANEFATASDKQNKESEELPVSLSVATRASQEAADGAVVPAQATERLASAYGPGGAVSKQLVSAAVSGLVAGACFSVVNRLLSRR